MSEPLNAVKISDHVYWVGAIDWALRDFHGYSTERGTTYNAYLVVADQIALIDTVKAAFREEMMARIASVVEPGKIDYIISNHAEMDHSGCLPEVIDLVKPEKVFASAKGAEALEAHFHRNDVITAVKDGETLSLGNLELTFMETRMLHWPDSMFTFLAEEGVLFSQDGFGMHLASSERFADELEDGLLEYEAGKYFANILLPLTPMVRAALGKAARLNISTIAPDHGPIWRKDLGRIVELYAKWADQKPTAKAVIVYDTMWGSTERMAKAIEEGLAAEGIAVKSMRLRENHRSNIIAEILEAGAILVGSPTLNNTMFPTIADVLMYLKGLKPKNKIGAVFGSYGWSGEAVTHIKDLLGAMRIELVCEPLNAVYVPDEAMLAECRDLGRRVGAKLKETAAARG